MNTDNILFWFLLITTMVNLGVISYWYAKKNDSLDCESNFAVSLIIGILVVGIGGWLLLGGIIPVKTESNVTQNSVFYLHDKFLVADKETGEVKYTGYITPGLLVNPSYTNASLKESTSYNIYNLKVSKTYTLLEITD